LNQLFAKGVVFLLGAVAPKDVIRLAKRGHLLDPGFDLDIGTEIFFRSGCRHELVGKFRGYFIAWPALCCGKRRRTTQDLPQSGCLLAQWGEAATKLI
jgi:hypothetical protein